MRNLRRDEPSVKYIKAKWLTASSDDPVLLYSEIDDARREIRKVEVYRDGSAGWADQSHECDSTMLGILPLPPLDEINAQIEFEAVEITPDEFESAWFSFRKSN